MRLAFALVLAATGSAAADGGGYTGIGFGPKLAVDGLGDQFAGSAIQGRLVAGLRLGRIGAELSYTFAGIDSALVDTAAMVGYRPALTAHVIPRGRLRLFARVGLGFHSIGGTTSMTVPCRIEEECGTKIEQVSRSFHGISFDAGVTAQLHLGRKRSHVALWIDLAGARVRQRVEDANVAGYTRALTIGVAHAMD